ncbi:MAG TPA: serine/threonine-protein kinase [Thermoanaerobaculia bacterium]|nr:serine/threonine-protein kinase [Thermoanaerobaculia bacterium]
MPSDTVHPGQRLLHFLIVKRLRGGGMGDVLLAWDEHLDRHVVLKRLSAGRNDAAGQQRLEREARSAARLRSANIVIIHDLQYVDGAPMLIQDYVEGNDLDALVGKLPLTRSIDIAGQIASGLSAAHAAGIVHRDLKPHNIRVRPDGVAVILDFGLGKAFLAQPEDRTQLALTKEGTLLGTPSYMAPEQLTGGALSPATDVFAFGVLFYEMLTGVRPFSGETQPALFAAILQSEPKPLAGVMAIPVHVSDLVEECLRKDPASRPTAEHLHVRLSAAVSMVASVDAAGSGPARPDTTAIRFVENVNRYQAHIRDNYTSSWAALHRKRALSAAGKEAVCFELCAAIGFPLPEFPAASLKTLLQKAEIAGLDSNIGRIPDGERFRLNREAPGSVWTEFSETSGYSYWAASNQTEFYYLTTLPTLKRGGISIEVLLGETIRSLAYLRSYAPVVGAPKENWTVRVQIVLHNAKGRPLGGADWSNRWLAVLDLLSKPAGDHVASTMEVALPFLRSELPTAVKVLFDDLVSYFDFVHVPLAFYEQTLAHVFGTIRI